jgi:hypothetical protein
MIGFIPFLVWLHLCCIYLNKQYKNHSSQFLGSWAVLEFIQKTKQSKTRLLKRIVQQISFTWSVSGKQAAISYAYKAKSSEQ